MSNRDALIAGIDGLAGRLGEVRGWLAAGDADAVSAWNDGARGEREALLGAGLVGGMEGQPALELRVSVPNRPGVIAEIALALGRAGVNILDMVLSPSQDNRQGVVALVDRRLRARPAGLRADRRPRLPRRASMSATR